MKKIIISGKGGAGKTTFTAVLAHVLANKYPSQKMLIIDGDASSTLPFILGAGETFKKYMPVGELKPRVSGPDEEVNNIEQFKSKCLMNVSLGGHSVDFAYMGHHSTNDCFCAYNEALSLLLGSLDKNNSYDIVVVDREAGLEHLTRNIYPSSSDFLVLVSWLSDDYFNVIKEISDTADILGSTKNRILVVNDILNNYKSEESINDFIKKYSLQVIGWSLLPHFNSNSLINGKVEDVLKSNENLVSSVDKVVEMIYKS